MKLILVAWFSLFVLGSIPHGVTPVHEGHDHDEIEKTPYEECRDKCKDNFNKCYEERCAKLPDSDRGSCWMECLALPEVKGCYEACDDQKK